MSFSRYSFSSQAKFRSVKNCINYPAVYLPSARNYQQPHQLDTADVNCPSPLWDKENETRATHEVPPWHWNITGIPETTEKCGPTGPRHDACNSPSTLADAMSNCNGIISTKADDRPNQWISLVINWISQNWTIVLIYETPVMQLTSSIIYHIMLTAVPNCSNY